VDLSIFFRHFAVAADIVAEVHGDPATIKIDNDLIGVQSLHRTLLFLSLLTLVWKILYTNLHLEVFIGE